MSLARMLARIAATITKKRTAEAPLTRDACLRHDVEKRGRSKRARRRRK